MRKSFVTSIVLLALPACGILDQETKPDPMWELCTSKPNDDRCVSYIKSYCEEFPDDEKLCLDAGQNAGDAGNDVDAGCQLDCPCSRDEQCPTEEPVCEPSSAMCVECSSSDDGVCTSQGRVCLEGGDSCVECNESADCGDETKPHCGSDNRCTACVEDADCSQFGKVCDVGAHQCVQCTREKTDRCDGDVCDSLQRTCAEGVKPRSSDLCQPCIADVHCPEGTLCMPISFEEQDTGFFCLPKREAGESCINDHRPYAATINGGVGDAVPSVDFQTNAVCGLELTTCQALNDFRNTSCTGPADDDACGAPGIDDGVCAPVPADTVYRCSTKCLSDDDCFVGSQCTGSKVCRP